MRIRSASKSSRPERRGFGDRTVSVADVRQLHQSDDQRQDSEHGSFEYDHKIYDVHYGFVFQCVNLFVQFKSTLILRSDMS